MAQGISYGGVPLAVGCDAARLGRLGPALRPWLAGPGGSADRDLQEALRDEATAAWIAEHIAVEELYEFAYRAWPGGNLTKLTFPAQMVRRPVRVGSLWWPTGASRWAVGHFLCGAADLATLLPLAYDSEAPYVPQALELLLDDGRPDAAGLVSAWLYLLPPRPLTNVPGADGPLWLLTLVDERFYWWWQHSGLITLTAGTSTWDDLYTTLATQLGTTIDHDPVDADYFKPHAYSQLAAAYENVPMLLDAVAYNCGQRLTRTPDGLVRAINAGTAQQQRDANLAAAGDYVEAGDELNYTQSLAAALPEQVLLAFRRWSGSALVAPPAWITKTKAVQTVPGYSSYTGYGTKFFRCMMPANDGTGTPSNDAHLQTLCDQVARDFCDWQAFATVDQVWGGIVPWPPDGLHDVEWTWRLDRVNTRVQRRPWNEDPEELMQSDGTEQREGGFTGTVGPFYKYACVGSTLTQYTSTGFVTTNGLVQGNIASYV